MGVVSESLAYDVLVADRTLTPEERLHIVHMLKACRKNLVPRAYLYLECGCVTEAMPILKKLQDWRKLGEIAWRLGDEKKALAYFQKPASGNVKGVRSRYEPDYDRILQLQFLQHDWIGFLNAFRDAKVFAADKKGVVIRGVRVSATPWIRHLAVAVSKSNIDEPVHSWGKVVEKSFGIDEEEWGQMLEWARSVRGDELSKEMDKVKPAFLDREIVSLDFAVERGATEQATSLLKWIKAVSAGYQKIVTDLNQWFRNGDEESLKRAVDLITGSDIFAMTKTVFFHINRRNKQFDPPTERWLDFYRSHDHLFRLGFGHYMSLHVKSGGGIGDEELLTAVYQAMAWPLNIEKRQEDRLSIEKLRACEEWAIHHLHEWRAGEGKALVEATERDIRETAATGTDARKLDSWGSMSNEAVAYLDALWREEIGISPWISENLLFQLIKDKFKEYEVIQHDQPSWLFPQHLDVHVPKLKFAVEYMGLQHYEAVEFFGGVEGLKATIERDARKKELCDRAGLTENAGVIIPH